jgi:transcriptional regulator with XRE-family HTH domain
MTKSGGPGGNRLRALREFYGRSQLDVELDGNLGVGYLQRVESGKVKQPERDTLDRILTALNATYMERRDILELFGYVVDAPIPDEREIQWAIAACQTELDGAVFPVYVLDCAHRLLAWNALVPQIFRIDRLLHPIANAERLSMLNIIFDPAYGVTESIVNREAFFPAQIRALRSEMQWFRDEDWYKRLIGDMLKIPEFEKYWTADTLDSPRLAARPLTPLSLKLPTGDILQFRLIAEPFVQDRRFRVIYCLPADTATIQQCVNWLEDSGRSHSSHNPY